MTLHVAELPNNQCRLTRSLTTGDGCHTAALTCTRAELEQLAREVVEHIEENQQCSQ